MWWRFNIQGQGGLTKFGDPSDLEQLTGCDIIDLIPEYLVQISLHQAVSYVHSRHPSSVLFVVSEGSGSGPGVLLLYLGECRSGTYLTAAAVVSPVLLGQLWFETTPKKGAFPSTCFWEKVGEFLQESWTWIGPSAAPASETRDEGGAPSGRGL